MQVGETVGRDLETLSIVDNVKGQGKDTLGRKKSTGRPKSSKLLQFWRYGLGVLQQIGPQL